MHCPIPIVQQWQNTDRIVVNKPSPLSIYIDKWLLYDNMAAIQGLNWRYTIFAYNFVASHYLYRHNDQYLHILYLCSLG